MTGTLPGVSFSFGTTLFLDRITGSTAKNERSVMSAATLQHQVLYLGPDSAGILLAPRDFDRAEFTEGWRYELIKGVLVVSPPPLEMERDPNDELGRQLRNYQEMHPQGACMDKTLPEHTVRTRKHRRRADRVIWIGLGRRPGPRDV